MKDYKLDMVFVDKVIICNKELRGDGEKSPYRRVLQVFDFDGEMIAENDSYRQSYDEVNRFAKQLTSKLAELNNSRASQFVITQETRKYLFSFFGMIEKDRDYLK